MFFISGALFTLLGVFQILLLRKVINGRICNECCRMVMTISYNISIVGVDWDDNEFIYQERSKAVKVNPLFPGGYIIFPDFSETKRIDS